MRWTVETVSAVDTEIEALPLKLRARPIRLLETVESVGLERSGSRMSSISRAGSGNGGPRPKGGSRGGSTLSFATLRRYAEATGTRLAVGLVRADT